MVNTVYSPFIIHHSPLFFMKNKHVIVVAGANGSGKTTFAKSLIEETGLAFLNADEISAELGEIPAANLKAGRIFLEKLDAWILAEQSFILESTLAGRYLIRIFDLLKKNGYKISLVYLFLENPDICIARVNLRVRKGGHFVPEKDIRRRYFRSIDNFWNIYRSKCDDWKLIFNSEFDFEEIAFGRKETKISNEILFDLFQQKIIRV
jgi:predicted ABC-type ATPase